MERSPKRVRKIEDRPGFVGKVRIAREDPASMLPGAKGIAAEPAPQSGAADLGNQALRNDMLTDLLDGKTRQRKPQGCVEVRKPMP